MWLEYGSLVILIIGLTRAFAARYPAPMTTVLGHMLALLTPAVWMDVWWHCW